jgi:hypothetical protein
LWKNSPPTSSPAAHSPGSGRPAASSTRAPSSTRTPPNVNVMPHAARRRRTGVILGPLMETQARRALVGSGGDVGVFVGRPLTVVLLLVAIAAVIVPHVPALMQRMRGGDGGPGAFGGAED